MEQPKEFVFGLNIPVNVPTAEEINLISGSLEASLKKLIDIGYMNREEAVAYVKFTLHLAAFTPFVLDAFLESYRKNTLKIIPEKSRIIKPQF
jgi:hypothetical protein